VRGASSVLDLGCGTGTDAAWLAGRGHEVTGVDASAGMLAIAEAATRGLRVRLIHGDLASPPPGPFDAALSNFGALNCGPLEPVAAALARSLRVGAPLVVVLLGHRSPAEAVALGVRGHVRTAWRRRRDGSATVGGVDVDVRFHRPHHVRAAFEPAFSVEQVHGLGLVLPPPGPLGRSLHRLAAALAPADRALGRHIPWGDHVIYVLRRTTAAAAP
jgi:SAM-dependent methyltransferase